MFNFAQFLLFLRFFLFLNGFLKNQWFRVGIDHFNVNVYNPFQFQFKLIFFPIVYCETSVGILP